MNNPFTKRTHDGFGLHLSKAQRDEIFAEVMAALETISSTTEQRPVFNVDVQSEAVSVLRDVTFKLATKPSTVMQFVLDGMQTFQLNTAHPSYFGVFNPRASTMGIVAELIVAALNPQLASSMSSKFCIGIEDALIGYFGQRFGYASQSIEGNFTVGATEANHTALLCALHHRFPSFAREGVFGLSAPVVIYCSTETHHSVLRAARLSGLGMQSVCTMPVDSNLQFNVGALREQIARDRAAKKIPLFLVGTLGSTSAGTIDPLSDLADVAKESGLWFHVDAAFGGAVCLLDEFSNLIKATAQADSIAFDPHKWLSVPMGCGMYLTKHKGSLLATFDVEGTSYMPLKTRTSMSTEPYRQSMQWSRRFMGLKLFMSLAVHGEEGYQQVLRHQMQMGTLLKKNLAASDWLIRNDSPLPVACFTDGLLVTRDVHELVKRVIKTKRAFLTTTTLASTNEPVARAGIPNYMTQSKHVDQLTGLLNDARRDVHIGRQVNSYY